MRHFSFHKTDIEGLTYIETFYAEDDRGYFSKYYEKDIFNQNGIESHLNECFYSQSIKGVIRGMHFQTENSQAKLICVNHGIVYDVAVDLRKGSQTFGNWQGFYLSSKEKNALYIPKGFAHGFIGLDELNIMTYCCDGPYLSNCDSGILWNDNDISISWPLEKINQPIISLKDQQLQSFNEFYSNYGGL